MTRQLSGGTATVATGRDILHTCNEGYIRNRDVPFQSVTLDITSVTDELGIPTNAPQVLPPQCHVIIYRIIKNFKERGVTTVKKSSGHPRVSNKCQYRLLLRSQLQNRVTSSAELAQEWQQVGVRASACTVRPRLWTTAWCQEGQQEATYLQEKHQGQTEILQEVQGLDSRKLVQSYFSDEAPFRLFGTSGKLIVLRRKGEYYHEFCVVPTVKHPETIYVWGCSSTK
ncbi:hypothetical protein cypCar_00019992 [Cyprinus carpio]|nr:hypothetical protein cypCar_00019992 [Cyprinus carpio]